MILLREFIQLTRLLFRPEWERSEATQASFASGQVHDDRSATSIH